MFEIEDSKAFCEKLVFDYEELRREPTSARVALNCVITAYHLAEWV